MPALPRTAAAEAARRVLDAHLTARDYGPAVDAAAALLLPAGIADDDDLLAVSAAAIAHGFGLLALERREAVRAVVDDALRGAADAALSQARPATVLAWCTAMGEWCERHGLDAAFHRLHALADAADSRPGCPASARVHWRVAAAWHHEAFGRFAGVASLLAEAAAIAAAAGDTALQSVVALKQARLALARAAPAEALARAAEVEARADAAADPLWRADVADIRARAALARGELQAALHEARRCDGLARQAHATPAYTVTYRANEAYALLGLGCADEAVALVQALSAIEMPARMQQRTALLAALFALVRDERAGHWGPAQREALREAVRRLRELDWHGVFALLPQTVARLWARALEAGIETEWVRAAIVARGLAPPEASWPDAWPWPLRVHVLGGFACAPLAGSDAAAKAASRPLALLRRLAAEGGLEPVPTEALAQALWPGEGREGRDKALEVTLARLRRLLGDASAVLLQDRRLRLNPERVWLDSAALARVLGLLEHGLAQGHGDDALQPLWDEAMALWRGPLLAGEAADRWLDDARGRLRRRMAAALHAAAERPGHRARCLRATAADPALAEDL